MGLGAGGTTRIAKVTQLRHTTMCMSRSVIGLRGGAELLSKLALLSLTGLKKTVYVTFFFSLLILNKREIKLYLAAQHTNFGTLQETNVVTVHEHQGTQTYCTQYWPQPRAQVIWAPHGEHEHVQKVQMQKSSLIWGNQVQYSRTEGRHPGFPNTIQTSI